MGFLSRRTLSRALENHIDGIRGEKKLFETVDPVEEAKTWNREATEAEHFKTYSFKG